MLAILIQKPTESIPAASKGWHETKAAYRFLSNKMTSFEKVLKPHTQATIERIKQEPDVKINIVYAKPPRSVEPIEWFLLTSLPIDTKEQVTQSIYVVDKPRFILGF